MTHQEIIKHIAIRLQIDPERIVFADGTYDVPNVKLSLFRALGINALPLGTCVRMGARDGNGELHSKCP